MANDTEDNCCHAYCHRHGSGGVYQGRSSGNQEEEGPQMVAVCLLKCVAIFMIGRSLHHTVGKCRQCQDHNTGRGFHVGFILKNQTNDRLVFKELL